MRNIAENTEAINRHLSKQKLLLQAEDQIWASLLIYHQEINNIAPHLDFKLD